MVATREEVAREEVGAEAVAVPVAAGRDMGFWEAALGAAKAAVAMAVVAAAVVVVAATAAAAAVVAPRAETAVAAVVIPEHTSLERRCRPGCGHCTDQQPH